MPLDIEVQIEQLAALVGDRRPHPYRLRFARHPPRGLNTHSRRRAAPPRPELHHWRPLFILLLWRSDVACHMDARCVVERGRRIDRRSGAVPGTMDVFVNVHGEEVEVERRQEGLYAVSQEEVPPIPHFL